MSETQVTTEEQSVDTDNLDTFATEFFSGKTKAKTEDAKPQEVEQEPEVADDAEVDTEAQDQEDQADPNTDPEAEYKEAPPKKKTVQDRIDELVKQREDTKREAAAELEKVRKDFEEKLAALQPKQADAKSANEPTPEDVNEDGTPKYALGEFDPQYVRDLTKFTFAQEREQARKETETAALVERETAARQALTGEWNTKVEAAKTSYPDFQSKAQTLLDGLSGLPNDYAGYLSTVIMSMDHGTDVLYYLSNNPEEAVKIVNSGAQKATLALGRIEAKFYEADAQKQAAKPKVSKAPPPPTERARGTNGAFVAVAPDTDDLDAFTAEFFRKRK